MESFDDQTTLAAYCRSKLHHQLDRVDELVSALSTEQRRRPREDGGWSIDQILEHLATINRRYIQKIWDVPEAPYVSPAWSPTLAGRFLRWTVTTPRRLNTPRIFEPQPLQASEDALNHFLSAQSELLELIDRFRNVSWKKTRALSPATPLMRLNLGDCFLILADHGERHVGQLERQYEAVTSQPARAPDWPEP